MFALDTAYRAMLFSWWHTYKSADTAADEIWIVCVFAITTPLVHRRWLQRIPFLFHVFRHAMNCFNSQTFFLDRRQINIYEAFSFSVERIKANGWSASRWLWAWTNDVNYVRINKYLNNGTIRVCTLCLSNALRTNVYKSSNMVVCGFCTHWWTALKCVAHVPVLNRIESIVMKTIIGCE